MKQHAFFRPPGPARRQALAARRRPAAGASATARRTLLRLVDLERAAVELLTIPGFHRRLRVGRAAHLDEGEAAGLTSVAVGHDLDLDYFAAALLEGLAQRVFRRVERNVTDVQAGSVCHGILTNNVA